MNGAPPGPTVPWALFGFDGRIGREAYTLGVFFLVSLFAFVIVQILLVEGNENATIFWGLAFIVLGAVSAWSCLALTVKRLHDINAPVGLALVLLVPMIDVILLVGLMFLESAPEANEHGAPPQGR